MGLAGTCAELGRKGPDSRYVCGDRVADGLDEGCGEREESEMNPLF